MEGLKNYVADLSSKIIEKEVLLYDLDISKNSKLETIEN
jgi:hypothetical protein